MTDSTIKKKLLKVKKLFDEKKLDFVALKENMSKILCTFQSFIKLAEV
jgi:hypothetical protein